MHLCCRVLLKPNILCIHIPLIEFTKGFAIVTKIIFALLHKKPQKTSPPFIICGSRERTLT